MDNCYQSNKIEAVKEWLNQNRVLAKIVNHPRINEILNSIITESNLIDFSDPEQKRVFTEKFRFLANGWRVYFPGEEKRINVSWFNHNFIWSEDIIKEKNAKAPVRQIRIFDAQGIEKEYQIQRGNTIQNGEGKKQFVWNQDITYQRDSQNLLFWSKTVNYLGMKMTNYYGRKSGMSLQDLKIDSQLLRNLGINGQNLEDLSISMGKASDVQKMLKNMPELQTKVEQLFNEYCELNQRYLVTRQYEKVIQSRLGILAKEH